MEQPSSSPSFVGIDVSKDRLDAHILPSGQAFAVARNGEGLDQLAAELRTRAPALIVLEATGGFEVTVAAVLAGAGLSLAVVNPRQIRDFAPATGRLAKTDALDAQIIALFAERIRPEPRPIADAESLALSELVARRRQVVEMIGMEANRLRQARSPRVRRTIEATRKNPGGSAGRAGQGHRRHRARLSRLAGRGRPADLRPRHRRHHRAHVDRRSARTRPP